MFVPLLLETPKKALVHCTKPKVPEKALVHFAKPKSLAFLQVGKTWNLIPKCQENAY
jgi:hypothetical protein